MTTHPLRPVRILPACAALPLVVGGCAWIESLVSDDPAPPPPPPAPAAPAPPRPVSDELMITAHRLTVTLDPGAGTISARDAFVVAVRPGRADLTGPAELELQFAEGLTLRELRGPGGPVAPAAADPQRPLPAGRHRFAADLRGRSWDFEAVYEGRITADLEAGERAGHIHNREVAGHIGPQGVFLTAGSGWYPTLPPREPPAAAGPADPLPRFQLALTAPRDFAYVSQGTLTVADAPDGRRTWRWSPELPADSLTLVGASRRTAERPAGRVLVLCHTSEANAAHAPLFLKAAEDYLSDYERLLGPYPYTRFEIFENFFSSGFAYPGFTLLGPAVIAMGERALRPGYLDHELVHNWFGNGVFVDPRGGNWCEGLTSYLTNYLQTAAAGPAAAARHRADIVRRASLAAAGPKPDFPLSLFATKPEYASPLIGYSKATMVFHMLAARLGQERVFAGLRRFRGARLGRAAGWDDLRAALEDKPGELAAFFRQWVDEPGAPRLRLADVKAAPAGDGTGFRVTGELHQSGGFELSVPLVVTTDAGAERFVVNLAERVGAFALTATAKPLSVALDPDFEVYRFLPLDEIPATLSATLSTGPVRVILCKSDPAPVRISLRALAEQLVGRDGDIREVDAPGDVTADDLGGRSLVLLGSAALSPAALGLLAKTPAAPTPVRNGFEWDGVRYIAPGSALLLNVAHPSAAGKFVTLYFGNDAVAVARADLIPFYGGDGWIVFDNGRPLKRGESSAAPAGVRINSPE